MQKRLHVLLDEEEYLEIQSLARQLQMTVAEWIRQALRRTMNDHHGEAEAKLRAIADASRHRFPTADIDKMLSETEVGSRTL